MEDMTSMTRLKTLLTLIPQGWGQVLDAIGTASNKTWWMWEEQLHKLQFEYLQKCEDTGTGRKWTNREWRDSPTGQTEFMGEYDMRREVRDAFGRPLYEIRIGPDGKPYYKEIPIGVA